MTRESIFGPCISIVWEASDNFISILSPTFETITVFPLYLVRQVKFTLLSPVSVSSDLFCRLRHGWLHRPFRGPFHQTLSYSQLKSSNSTQNCLEAKDRAQHTTITGRTKKQCHDQHSSPEEEGGDEKRGKGGVVEKSERRGDKEGRGAAKDGRLVVFGCVSLCAGWERAFFSHVP